MDNNMRQYAIFDGNPWVSPMAVIFAVFGVFFLAAIPPVGVVLLFVAWRFQHRRRKLWKQCGRAAQEVAYEREETARMKAYLSI